VRDFVGSDTAGEVRNTYDLAAGCACQFSFSVG
jgi:hypothetical protein